VICWLRHQLIFDQVQINPVIDGSPEPRDINSFGGTLPRSGMFMLWLVRFHTDRKFEFSA